MNRYQMILMTILFFAANRSVACPCGCGATGPQVLYPGEEWKFYVAANRMFDFTTVLDNGTRGSEAGPDYRDTLTLAVARALTSKLSTTLTVLSHQNLRDGEQTQRSLGDPSVSLRYTALQQNMASPWSPQIQVFVTYKHPVARSIYETTLPYQMDVFGNGIAEIVPGVDAWFGMDEWRVGVAEQLSIGLKRKLDEGQDISPGLSQRSSISGGYTWMGEGSLLLSLDRETQQPSTASGVKTGVRVTNGLSITGSYALAFRQTAVVSLKQAAIGPSNRNTTGSYSATVSYLQAL